MDVALRLENLYHEIMLEQCKTEEARQWEVARHQILTESIRDSCNYYAQRNVNKENNYERER